MATTPVNNIVRSNAPKSIFESILPVVDDTVNYNQGDLIAFNTSSKLLKAVTSATGDSANFLGVARQTLVDGKPKSPYTTAVDASQGFQDAAGPVYGVTVFLKLTAGDAFDPGSKVYLTDTDAQTITSTNPGDGNYIGIFQGKAIASAATGTTGEVLLGARYDLAGFSI